MSIFQGNFANLHTTPYKQILLVLLQNCIIYTILKMMILAIMIQIEVISPHTDYSLYLYEIKHIFCTLYRQYIHKLVKRFLFYSAINADRCPVSLKKEQD